MGVQYADETSQSSYQQGEFQYEGMDGTPGIPAAMLLISAGIGVERRGADSALASFRGSFGQQ